MPESLGILLGCGCWQPKGPDRLGMAHDVFWCFNGHALQAIVRADVTEVEARESISA